MRRWRSADAPLVAVVDENDVLCGVVRAARADGDGPVSSRAEPAEATVPLSGKLQDALAKVLLTDLGWVAVVDGARYVGGLTPESVFESLRRSMDISDAEERTTADRGIPDPQRATHDQESGSAPAL